MTYQEWLAARTAEIETLMLRWDQLDAARNAIWIKGDSAVPSNEPNDLLSLPIEELIQREIRIQAINALCKRIHTLAESKAAGIPGAIIQARANQQGGE